MIKKKLAKAVGFTMSLLISAGCIVTANAAEINIDSNKASAQISNIALPFDGESTVLNVKASALPEKYSSKDLGYVTPVRNQSNTDDCWAFSSTASLETLLAKNNEIDATSQNWLSVSHMDAWGSKRSDGSGWQREYEYGGGYPFIAIGYFTSWTGGIKEDLYPFRSPFSMFDINKKYDIDYGVTGLMYLDGSDHNTIKKSIMDNGSVVSSFNYLSQFSKDNGKNYYCPDEQSKILGHSICIVGWDDSYSKDNFKVTTASQNEGVAITPKNDGAWLCKNSWGTTTGDEGFFWISYEDYYLFSNNFGPTYSINDYIKKDDTTNIKQVETFGCTYEFSYLGFMNNCTFINVFDFDGEEGIVDKVLFETESVGATYKIYNIPFNTDNASPDDNKRKWVEIGTGTVPYSGYICVDTKNFEAVKGKSCIGINIDTSNTDSLLSIGSTEWLSNKGVELFVTDAKRDTSYINYGQEQEDIMDFYYEMLDDEKGGNFVIKAITTQIDDILGDVNLDGKLDITDATELQKYINHSVTFSKLQINNSDFNEDGEIDIKDVTSIQKHLAGIK